MIDCVGLEAEYVQLHARLQGQLHALQAVIRLLSEQNAGRMNGGEFCARLGSLYAGSLSNGEDDFSQGERVMYRKVFVDFGFAREEKAS